MRLADLQNDFHMWLTSASPDAAARLGNDAAAGLAVYQNNYRGQLVSCLEASFPHLRTWIGETAFLGAAIDHIDRTPPHAWTLDAYADGFHAALALRYPDNPDVRELAWIEHTLAAAFVAPDADPLALAAAASTDWDTARLRLVPSFAGMAAATNAEQIWSALWNGEAPPEAEMLAAPAGVIVWRRQFTSCLRQVDALELAALRQLQGDGSFSALCDLLVAQLGEADGVARAGALLATWLSSELIAAD